MQDFSKLLRQSPETVGAGRLAPRAFFHTYATEADALAGGENPYTMTLNGEWRFKWFENPDLVTDEFRPETDDSQWDRIAVPGCWDMRGYGYPHYTNINMPFPDYPPSVPLDRNPAAVYRRTFTLPESWRGRRTILRFDGVENLFYAFVNGALAGFSKDSRGASEFDITEKLVEGENKISVFVTQYSDAAYVEDQDQWWHAGIVRNVTLLSRPENRIEDICVTSTLDGSLKNGLLKLELIARLKPLKGAFSEGNNGMVEYCVNRPQEGWFFDLRLLDAAGGEVWKTTTDVGHKLSEGVYFNAKDPARLFGRLEVELPAIHAWNAEDPYRYTLTVTLRNQERG
ncbi:MAG: hypothetical protein PUK77_06835, partial [bacterium]|nr:hypothetical protein [bacterium]